jgi:hypothetical protein
VSDFSLRSSRRRKAASLSRNHRRWSKIRPNGPIIQSPAIAGAVRHEVTEFRSKIDDYSVKCGDFLFFSDNFSVAVSLNVDYMVYCGDY